MDTLQMEERLWEYIDNVCTPIERAEVEMLLQREKLWKEKYMELIQVHRLINASDLEEPSLRFTQNVMEDIAKFQIAPAASTYINKKIIFGIGGFFLVMIVGMLVYTFGQIDWSAPGSAGNFQLELKEIEWSKYVSNTYTNIFMMVNVVLALVLLDQYLTRKKDRHKQHQA